MCKGHLCQYNLPQTGSQLILTTFVINQTILALFGIVRSNFANGGVSCARWVCQRRRQLQSPLEESCDSNQRPDSTQQKVLLNLSWKWIDFRNNWQLMTLLGQNTEELIILSDILLLPPGGARDYGMVPSPTRQSVSYCFSGRIRWRVLLLKLICQPHAHINLHLCSRREQLTLIKYRRRQCEKGPTSPVGSWECPLYPFGGHDLNIWTGNIHHRCSFVW